MRGLPMIYPHITMPPRGVPCIDGTRHRVIDIVADHVAHGYSAAQIVEQYPDLTLAQVYAALAYYYDHEDELNATLMARYAQASTDDTSTGRIRNWSQHAHGTRTNTPTLHGRAC